jgi:small subunit ribosomal protein S21
LLGLKRFLYLQPIFKEEKHMLIIPVKEGESIDRSLKKFKKKFEKTGVVKELRRRQAYTKKSVTRREEIKHAVYLSAMKNQEV